jgi:serine/threonine protein kinase
MPLSAGDKLGPYEILSSLGAGGMGEVYRARDTRLGRSVAIKVLLPDLSERQDLQSRFEVEARAIASLNHPSICALFDVGHHDGVAFMVMEYLEGETLASRLTKGPLPLPEALRYGAEITHALEQAHRRGVAHRDLKPANIMLTRSGVKLLDFGLARLHEPASPAGEDSPTITATRQGILMGTPQYMSVEQALGKETDPAPTSLPSRASCTR